MVLWLNHIYFLWHVLTRDLCIFFIFSCFFFFFLKVHMYHSAFIANSAWVRGTSQWASMVRRCSVRCAPWCYEMYPCATRNRIHFRSRLTRCQHNIISSNWQGNMAPLKLYYDLMSQPSRAVYIFLKVNNIAFEEKPIALRKGKQPVQSDTSIATPPFWQVEATGALNQVLGWCA